MDGPQALNLDSRHSTWKEVYKVLLPGVSDVIIAWLRDIDKSQYLQLWMGHGHQIWTADASFEVVCMSLLYR